MNFKKNHTVFLRISTVCIVLLCCACSMVTGKSRLDKFLDGDNPETRVVVKNKNSASEMELARETKNTKKGDVQLTSLTVAEDN